MKLQILVKILAYIAAITASQAAFSIGLPVEDLDTQPGPVKNTGEKCSLKTLKGTYLYAAGYLGPKGDQQEQSGIEYYDGKGQITGKLTAKILPDQVYSNIAYNATYEINPDCTGKTFNKSVHMTDIFVSPDGKYFTQTMVMKGYQGSSITTRATKKLVSGLLPTNGN
jgi:hypothetical protein